MTEEIAPIDTRTPEEKTRQRRVRARLKRATERVGMYEARLRGLHGDRSGTAHLMYQGRAPIGEWEPLARTLRTVLRDCREGCPLSIDWMAGTEKQRAAIDELRLKRLPKADPNYNGPPVWPGSVKYLGRRKVSAITRTGSEGAAAARMAEVLEREEARRAQARAERHGSP